MRTHITHTLCSSDNSYKNGNVFFINCPISGFLTSQIIEICVGTKAHKREIFQQLG